MSEEIDDDVVSLENPPHRQSVCAAKEDSSTSHVVERQLQCEGSPQSSLNISDDVWFAGYSWLHVPDDLIKVLADESEAADAMAISSEISEHFFQEPSGSTGVVGQLGHEHVQNI